MTKFVNNQTLPNKSDDRFQLKTKLFLCQTSPLLMLDLVSLI